MPLVATQVKRRRGTTAENDAFTGAEGEITVDTEKHELRVHDGVTQGGFTIPTTETMDSASKSLDNLSASGEARFTSKADSDLSNIPSNIDYVVASQAPTAENNYTWYRKYKSGWVEQGGMMTWDLNNNNVWITNTVSFPLPMKDTLYTPIFSIEEFFGLEQEITVTSDVRNTSSLISGMYREHPRAITVPAYIYWVVVGMGQI